MEMPRGLPIKFFLQAEPSVKDGAVVRECFECEPVPGTAGAQAMGHVDEDIKVQHAPQYAAFKALVDENKDELFAAAKAELGKRIFPVAQKIVQKVEEAVHAVGETVLDLLKEKADEAQS